jgi:hypothetical protein
MAGVKAWLWRMAETSSSLARSLRVVGRLANSAAFRGDCAEGGKWFRAEGVLFRQSGELCRGARQAKQSAGWRYTRAAISGAQKPEPAPVDQTCWPPLMWISAPLT